jgi:hypothetical protein
LNAGAMSSYEEEGDDINDPNFEEDKDEKYILSSK